MNNKVLKVIVAGSRSVKDYNFVSKVLDDLFANDPTLKANELVIVSGTCKGPDMLGENYAFNHGLKVERHPAKWELGKKAGYLRNAEMRDVSDVAVVFWDGVSSGSKHMIDLMKSGNKPVIVVDSTPVVVPNIGDTVSNKVNCFNVDDVGTLHGIVKSVDMRGYYTVDFKLNDMTTVYIGKPEEFKLETIGFDEYIPNVYTFEEE